MRNQSLFFSLSHLPTLTLLLLLLLLLHVAALLPFTVAQSSDSSSSVPYPTHCPPLPAPRHGSVTVLNATLTTPMLSVFSCAAGRELNGTDSAACLRSGGWSHAVPKCVSVGVRSYPQRRGTASIGLLSIHDEDILLALAESAQKQHAAVGFTLRTRGSHKAYLLKQDPSISLVDGSGLIPSDSYVTFLFSPEGKLLRMDGFNAPQSARLQAVQFSDDAVLVKGIRKAVLKRKSALDTALPSGPDTIIGFSIQAGPVFRVQLLGWSGLPLQESESHTSFLLREEVEDKIVELGCFRGDPSDSTGSRGSLVSVQSLPGSTNIKSARLNCAAIARSKGHAYFAVSQSSCFSGNGHFNRFGSVSNPLEEGAKLGKKSVCALSAKTAAALKLSKEERSEIVVGAGAISGYFHTFSMSRDLLPVPELLNGGFEDGSSKFRSLFPLYPGLSAEEQAQRVAPKKARQQLRIVSASSPNKVRPVPDWKIDTTRGEVGLLTWGASLLNGVGAGNFANDNSNSTVSVQSPIPEGKNVLYVKNEGSVQQTLLGLQIGRKYTLQWKEAYAPAGGVAGCTVRVSVATDEGEDGRNNILYENPYVSNALWLKRSLHFRPSAVFANLTFTIVNDNIPAIDPSVSSRKPDCTVLLDAIQLKEKKPFRSVRGASIGTINHGLLASVNTSDPLIIDAAIQITREQEQLGLGGLGFQLNPLRDNAALIRVGVNDLATLVDVPGSTVYLNNGTVLFDRSVSARSGSGSLDMRHPLFLKAVAKIARGYANSVGFSLALDTLAPSDSTEKQGLVAFIISSPSLPLQSNTAFNTYLFDPMLTELGCWSTVSGASSSPVSVNLLSTVHSLQQVSVEQCAILADKYEHSYFALQEGGVCVSGNNSPSDPNDDLYFSNGRSAQCATVCTNGRDICGGRGAGLVYRLPVYMRISRPGRGVVSLYPLHVTSEQVRNAQAIFDSPGSVLFTTISKQEVDNFRANLAALNETEAEGFQLINDSPLSSRNNASSSSSSSSWSHPVEYRFNGAERYIVSKYQIQAPVLAVDHPFTPVSWIFQGSNDGRKWKRIDVQHKVAFYTGQKRAFRLRNQQPYHFYRFLFTENGGVEAEGIGVQGIELFSLTSQVRLLQMLLRFDSSPDDVSRIGWDSSYSNNDLQLFGGLFNGTHPKDPYQLFNITTNTGADMVKHGSGSLEVRNEYGTTPSYLARDAELSQPAIPSGDSSFGVAFWFQVDSLIDSQMRFESASTAGINKPEKFTIISWGEYDSDRAASIQNPNANVVSVSLNPNSKIAGANHISLNGDFTSLRSSFGSVDSLGLSTPVQANTTLLDKWHHVAVSYDSLSGLHRIWLDGKIVASRVFGAGGAIGLDVKPRRFILGANRLSGEGAQTTDEFNGLLDDVAIFSGSLSTSVVVQIMNGGFAPYLPASCQQLSDEFQIESGVTWGGSESLPSVQSRFIRNKCYTKPTSCQTLSDQYGMTPASAGTANSYAVTLYEKQRCSTWPAVLVKENTIAGCPEDKLKLVENVSSRAQALHICHSSSDKCQAFVYGGHKGLRARSGEYTIKPFQMQMCATFLSDLRPAPGIAITTRISKFLLHPDSKLRCDSHALPTHQNVPSSIHARWLCDSTPGCVAYVWSGLVGAHSKGRPSTPGRLILCASIRNSLIFNYPGSGYEVGERLGSYLVAAQRYAACSDYAYLGVVSNITSSLMARKECDRVDGLSSAGGNANVNRTEVIGTGETDELFSSGAKCVSYAWDMQRSEVRLCSSVPQQDMQYFNDVETGFAHPLSVASGLMPGAVFDSNSSNYNLAKVQADSCQYMSDAFGISYGSSWGSAPHEVRIVYHNQGCHTVPSSCQTLSDKYGLSPNITQAEADHVPGYIRDAWLRSSCSSTPELKQSRFLIKLSFEDLQLQINALKQKIDRIEREQVVLSSGKLNPALDDTEKQALVEQLEEAKAIVQHKLDQLVATQEAELAPIMQRAADSNSTIQHTVQLFDIAAGFQPKQNQSQSP